MYLRPVLDFIDANHDNKNKFNNGDVSYEHRMANISKTCIFQIYSHDHVCVANFRNKLPSTKSN